MQLRQLGKILSCTLMTSALVLTTAWAAEYMSVAKDGINLRSGPDTKSDVLYQLPAGYPLEVVEKKGAWLKVTDYEGDKGWIQESMVNKTPHVIVKVKDGKVRSAPSTTEKVVGNVVKDVILTKVEQKGDWLKVSHPDLGGWIHKDLVWP